MQKKAWFIVKNEKGLHTRPSTELMKCATSFKSQVTLTYKGMKVNAKSLLGILMLAANKGAKLYVEALGPDAQEAISGLLELAAKKFNVQY